MEKCKHGMPTDWCSICTPRPKLTRAKILNSHVPTTVKKTPKPPRLCEQDGCGQKHYAKGYCRKHYDKFRPDNKDRHLLYYWRHREYRNNYCREYYWRHHEELKKAARENARKRALEKKKKDE